MAKYIDAVKLITEIKGIISAVQTKNPPDVLGTMEQCLAAAEIEAFNLVLDAIKELQQEQSELTPAPRIEQETQKKGWMDYGLLISEIGLHRSNAIDRIKETKERATEIKRDIAPHDLAILCEYLESAGAEIVLCCLQQYCMDFMFTQDEVKKVLQQEQPEADLEKEIDAVWNPRFNLGWDEKSLLSINRSAFETIARHFWNKGYNARKEKQK